MALPDALLVAQTLEGDLEGFGELHHRYFERVVRIVSGIVGERAEAADTAQNAYLAALKALPSLGNPDRFYPWLCRIAVNRAIEGKRSRERRSRLHSDWVFDEPAATEEGDERVLAGLEKKERAGKVNEALEQLPAGMKAAVVLRYFDGLSMRGVADVLGCEEVTARTQVFRGLHKLGRELGRMESDEG